MITKAATLWLCAALIGSALAADPPTDDEIRARIIEASIAAYPGSCPCPYNADRAGRRCGERSAWSKPGGEKPKCFNADISDDQVKRYRLAMGDT